MPTGYPAVGDPDVMSELDNWETEDIRPCAAFSQEREVVAEGRSHWWGRRAILFQRQPRLAPDFLPPSTFCGLQHDVPTWPSRLFRHAVAGVTGCLAGKTNNGGPWRPRRTPRHVSCSDPFGGWSVSRFRTWEHLKPNVRRVRINQDAFGAFVRHPCRGDPRMPYGLLRRQRRQLEDVGKLFWMMHSAQPSHGAVCRLPPVRPVASGKAEGSGFPKQELSPPKLTRICWAGFKVVGSGRWHALRWNSVESKDDWGPVLTGISTDRNGEWITEDED